MKIIRRLIALVLACLMLVPLFACSRDEDENSDGSGDEDYAATTPDGEDSDDPNSRKNHKDNLPELDFSGQEVLVFTNGMTGETGTVVDFSSQMVNWLGTETLSNELMQSVYQRNVTVERRLNIKLKFQLSDTTSYEGVKQKFKSKVSSGDYFCDILSGGNNAIGANGLLPYFRDISNIPYVEWEQPWWFNEMNDAYSMDGKTRSLITGDVLLATYGYGNVIFYNRRIYADTFGNADEPYDLVLGGAWTYEKFASLISESYVDVNGLDDKDPGDQYGIVLSNWKSQEFLPMLMSTNISLCQRDDTGKIIIDMDESTMDLIIGKFWSVIDNVGTYTTFPKISPESVGDRDKVIQEYFAKGKSLFQQHRLLGAAEYLTNMEDDYGIIPIPKIDTWEDKYYSGVETRSDVLGVPLSVTDDRLELIGATLEAMSAETHRECVDYFIDTVMRYRYSREEKSGMTIDLVMDNMVKSWLSENDGLTASTAGSDETKFLEKTIFDSFRKNSKSPSFSTLYTMYQSSAQNKITDAFDSYMITVAS